MFQFLVQFYQMYENLEDAIIHKRFVPTPRPFPSSRLQEHYQVEPWEKNTLQVDKRDQGPSRHAKTFYHAPPAVKKYHKQYTTHRGFSFWNHDPVKGMQKPKSLADVPRKSAINLYNISGNILGEGSVSNQSLPFQLPAKRTKNFRSKEKTQQIDDDKDPLPIRQTVSAMKRRINFKRQQSKKGFIKLCMNNEEEFPPMELQMKKSKVISLGFQKIANSKGFAKQRSLQLAVKGVVL